MIIHQQKVNVVSFSLFFPFSLKQPKKKKKKKDLSCPENKCLNNGKCSTRLNGNFYCQCLPPSSGTQCEIGSLSFLFILFYFFHFFLSLSQLLKIKNRRIRNWRTNNFSEFL